MRLPDAPPSRRSSWRRGAYVLAASVAVHAILAWLAVSVKVPERERPKQAISVQLVEGKTAVGERVEDKPAPAPPNGPVTRKQRPPKAPRKPAPVPVPAPESDAPAMPEQEASNEPAPEAPSPAPGPPVIDPRAVNLFDPNALGRSLSRWQRAQPSSPDRGGGRASGGGGDPDGDEAEHQRVSGRLTGFLAQAQARASAEAALADSCDNGIDDGLDGYLDCSAPSCWGSPACEGTRAYEDTDSAPIPDGSWVGGPALTRALWVAQGGTARKVTVRVRISHEAMHQVLLELVAPDGRKVVLHAPSESDDFYLTAFYVRELTGSPARGNWTLKVTDTEPGIAGRLVSWELYVTS